MSHRLLGLGKEWIRGEMKKLLGKRENFWMFCFCFVISLETLLTCTQFVGLTVHKNDQLTKITRNIYQINRFNTIKLRKLNRIRLMYFTKVIDLTWKHCLMVPLFFAGVLNGFTKSLWYWKRISADFGDAEGLGKRRYGACIAWISACVSMP